MTAFLKHYFEIIFWSTALILLATMPTNSDPHFSFCFFKFIGITFCPGCGLGHSISYIFHGNLAGSISTHPLGIIAVIVIIARMYKLLRLRLF
jgi:hypothetical protein